MCPRACSFALTIFPVGMIFRSETDSPSTARTSLELARIEDAFAIEPGATVVDVDVESAAASSSAAR